MHLLYKHILKKMIHCLDNKYLKRGKDREEEGGSGKRARILKETTAISVLPVISPWRELFPVVSEEVRIIDYKQFLSAKVVVFF